MAEAAKIIYTETDEAPALATHSLLPILQAFTKCAGIELETWDISLSGRIIANFPDNLTEEQRIPDYLKMCGDLCLEPSANLVKLPNISASIPQLKSAIAELQAKGYDVPDYPDEARNDEDREIQVRYSRVLGSAVNPVIREGNSDRRSSTAVKEHGKRNPHRMMQDWPEVSRTRVAYMSDGDFFGSEQAVTTTQAGTATIEFAGNDGTVTPLKPGIPLQEGEIIDCAVMSAGETAAVLHRADGSGQGRRHSPLSPREDHDDAGVRPYHLRPLRFSLLPRPVRQAWRYPGPTGC